MKKHFFAWGLLLLTAGRAQSQDHTAYVSPKDPLVTQKLNWWQDQKFGLLMHWGAYSQWGVVESWSICPEDEGWTQRHDHGAENYFTYLRNYTDLPKTFNPVAFNPDKWASAARALSALWLPRMPRSSAAMSRSPPRASQVCPPAAISP